MVVCVYDFFFYLSYDCFVIRCRSVRRYDDRVVSVVRDVVSSYDVIFRDIEVGGYWRSLDEILGVVEGVDVVNIIYVVIGDSVI